VRVTAHTPEGRDVEEYTFLWVSGGGEFFGSGPNRTVPIVPDKKSYRAGDTAHLLIVTGQPNTPVYVTVEGRDLREYKLIRSQDSTAAFDLPITAADEPGLTVAACFIRDGNFHSSDKWIKVPPVDHQLNVKVATDKPQYLPGQTADYSIDVTDGNGKPAPHAEFSLGVVDEAIYGIRKDDTPDILGFFLPTPMESRIYSRFAELLLQWQAGKRRMRLAELRPASRLAQLKPERLVQPKVRKAFPDTAFWAADVVTDNAGHAQAKVEFPRFAHHLARHRPRRHTGYQSGQRHAQNHRAQEPDPAAGRAALLRARR
jgi:alpha-2-macroglobulin